jgi:hypothetical protein
LTWAAFISSGATYRKPHIPGAEASDLNHDVGSTLPLESSLDKVNVNPRSISAFTLIAHGNCPKDAATKLTSEMRGNNDVGNSMHQIHKEPKESQPLLRDKRESKDEGKDS